MHIRSKKMKQLTYVARRYVAQTENLPTNTLKGLCRRCFNNKQATQSIFTPLGGSRKQLAYSPSQLQKCSRIYFFAMDSRIPRCRPTGVGQCSDFNWQNFQRFCKEGGIFQKFMAPGPSATNGLSEEHLNSKTQTTLNHD